MTRSTLFAGIDEAGLGPMLGPLTFGFSVFRAPADKANLWSSLRSVVSKDPKKDRDRFVVADSKVVFTRNARGRARLEQTALGFLSLLDEKREPPSDGSTLLFRRPRDLAPRKEVVELHPWYAHLPEKLPLEFSRARLELRVERLHRAMKRADVQLVDAGVHALPAGVLNRSYQRTHNKSLTVWQKSASVLRYLWKRHAQDELRLVVDRQGGRFRYGLLLEGTFPGTDVRCVSERPELSEYRVADPAGTEGRRRMRVVFAERAEERSFAVALASCLAKYARETSMGAFNRYFEALQPGLKPTAGYRTDGSRWMRDATHALEKAGLDPALLVRDR